MVPPATATRTIPFGCPIIGESEKRAVMEVLDGPLLTHGPRVKQFEARFAEFTGAEHAVATSSCAAALHMAYFCLGIGPGDEVIVPAQTHVATAHAVELCGARCVFVDAERRTGNIDIDLLEAAITERTRAVSIVHYLGMPVDMQRVLEIARLRPFRRRGLRSGDWDDLPRRPCRPARRRGMFLVLSGQAHDHCRGRDADYPPGGHRA